MGPNISADVGLDEEFGGNSNDKQDEEATSDPVEDDYDTTAAFQV